ncbi:MAG: SidE phosphodiesterase domain-containing protein [Coxiellaceae bacterium]|nr:SidE phosphodiesterase domain-containing protein [Coxiellaceae bacterium]
MRAIDLTEITHPLLDATRSCKANIGKAHTPFRSGKRWYKPFKTPPFYNIRLQGDGDIVRAQALFTDNKNAPRYVLMTMAAVLIAQHPQCKLNNKPLAIPCSGASMTTKYHQQASELLKHNITQLRNAYAHYRYKLYKDNTAHCLNKIKQVQQMLAGALFLQQQYLLMQTNSAGNMLMIASGYEQSELASRQIAKRYCSAGLNDLDSQPALHQAASSGNIEQLQILLNNPETAINQRNYSQRTALYMAAQANQLDAVKLLIAKGAIYSQATESHDSALTVALLNGHHNIVRYLSSCTPVKLKNNELPTLHHGPSKKNLALRHVEYILHCLLDIDFVSYPEEGDHYTAKNDGAGRPPTFRLAKDENNYIIAHCKNGKQYNLSLALKHANLCYFQLTESEHDRNIIRRCETLLGTAPNTDSANKLSSSIGRNTTGATQNVACYLAEQKAIFEYTGSRYQHMNELLRGAPSGENIGDLPKIIISSLLAISGVNKNIHANAFEESKQLIRGENELPDDMLARMQTTGAIIRRSGFLSFTNKTGSRDESNRLVIQSQHQWQGSVSHISAYQDENEVLLPPSHLRFNGVYRDDTSGRSHFSTQIVRGACADWLDEYQITLAMERAFTILKSPYKNGFDARFGIPRHNHALAHHTRASFFIQPVIDYFKLHAEDPSFKIFCDTLQPNEFIMMKIMMIFSKTGRESEASPLGSGLAEYMEYQQASAQNLSHFMREVMKCDEATIAFYAEIMLHMGNPNYPTLVTGANEEEKQRKLYINHITALAHKLDLPRVYMKSEYDNSMSGYNGTRQNETDALYIRPSAEQQSNLRQLESIALSCIKATGDNLCFSKHGIDATNYNEEQFIKSNTDISYCMQQCAIATTQVLQQSGINHGVLNKFKRALREHKNRDALKLLSQLSIDQLFNTAGPYPSAFEILISTDGDHTLVVDAMCQLAVSLPHTLLQCLHRAMKKSKHSYAHKIIQQLSTEMLNENIQGEYALIAAIRHNSAPEILDLLLAKGVNVNGSDYLVNLAIVTACKCKRQLALSKILAHESFKLSTMNGATHSRALITALKAHTPLSMIQTLLEHGLAIQLHDIPFAIEHPLFDVPLLLIKNIHQTQLQNLSANKGYEFTKAIFDLLHDHSYMSHYIVPAMHALSERGFDWYFHSDHGTALSKTISTSPDNLSACKYLITNGPAGYINTPTAPFNKTPLMIAADYNRIEVVKLLLQHGATVDNLDHEGNSALMIAIKRKNLQICREILPYCNPEILLKKNNTGHSAISRAMGHPILHKLSIEMMERCSLSQLDVYVFLRCFEHSYIHHGQNAFMQHFDSAAVISYLEQYFLDKKTMSRLIEYNTPHLKDILLQLTKTSNDVVLATLQNILAKSQAYLSTELQFECIRGIAIQKALLSKPLNHEINHIIDTLSGMLKSLPDDHEAFISALCDPSMVDKIITKIHDCKLYIAHPENRIKAQNLINEIIPGSYPQSETGFQISDFNRSSLFTSCKALDYDDNVSIGDDQCLTQ